MRRASLLGWFRHNRRDLPWRRTRDPYRIWLSEVMLQQTRVAAARGYYRRFLRKFPTLRSLARARSDAVLKLWSGLGYYRRAHNLRLAAKQMVERHNGRFPRELDAALSLPGIGRYTAAAVLSIAYNAPYAVLDGNVARVLARLGALRGDLRAPGRWRRLERQAQELLSVQAPGDWNQAMMELGATVCTPRAPKCSQCPVAGWCRARALGLEDQIPAARRKRAAVKVALAAGVLLDEQGRTLLVKEKGGLFSGLWQFPSVAVRRNARHELLQALRALAGRPANGTFRAMARLAPARHAVTFREITLVPFLARVHALPRVVGSRRVRLACIDSLPVSNATRKVARRAIEYAPGAARGET